MSDVSMSRCERYQSTIEHGVSAINSNVRFLHLVGTYPYLPLTLHTVGSGLSLSELRLKVGEGDTVFLLPNLKARYVDVFPQLEVPYLP